MKELNNVSKNESKGGTSSDFLSTEKGKTKSNAIEIPSISLPKGGGAIKGIDEKFSVNAVNGTAAFSIPLPFSPTRGITPSLSISYNSGAGNSTFGLGCNIGLSSIKRKTDKKLPQYLDVIDSDTFLFSDAEDFVSEFKKASDGSFLKDSNNEYVINEEDSADANYKIRFYRPRIEGLYARIERWTKKDDREIKWRIITKDNITTLFGWTSNSRLSDPDDIAKISEWLPEFVFDDKGNCSRYFYKPEDEIGIETSKPHNKNRLVSNRITYSNLYIHKILYGNKTPYKQFGDAFLPESDFLFETIFDYGTLKPNDSPDKMNEWDFRKDAFSDYKCGFEIRTTRLCKRVMLFHHFTGANEYDGLVRSLNFNYDTSTEQNFTYLKSIESIGYIKLNDGTYSSKKLPPLEFEYQKHEWSSEVQTISQEALIHAPSGLDEPNYQFVDLFNEGLSGILTEQATGWFYKHNLGGGNFEQAKMVSPKPSFAGLGKSLQLADLDADGGKQLVSYETDPKGYFELDDDNDWQPFRAFNQTLNLNFSDPYMRMIDLNGDGKSELLISDENQLVWYESDGRNGFKKALKSVKSFDEERGPAMVFADQIQTIFLADMSGDGLTDIVRIHHSEVCYWPNLGYGEFGSKVIMDNSPLFDAQYEFNPAFVRMADIDGSGTTDIIYLGKNKFSCWKNLSGNYFATTPYEITTFPEIHSAAKITVTDLLANGVACIVWSSPLAKDAHAPLRYIDLMNSKKPHIMISYKNNLGKEVSIEYVPSTKQYIEDKLSGNPWITKLHFPIHCVSKTIVEDKITGHKFISSYKYHHGYYDHPEREFRGFGMVEQTDAETFEHWEKSGGSNITNAELHQEPVVTKQWFHTGAFLRNNKILTQFAREYWYEEMFRQGFDVVHHEKKLDDAIVIPAKGIPQSVIDHLSAEEYQQAVRAWKGMALRSEVFAHDAVKFGNTPDALKKELTPFVVSTHNCVIELLQPKGSNKYAVFVVKESEAITYNYERNTEDPRIAHSLNIKLDEYGNVLESSSVVYPRKIVDGALPALAQASQAKTAIIYTVNNFTNDVIDESNNRQRLPAEVKTYELSGLSKTEDYYSLNDFGTILDDSKSTEALYHELDKPVVAGKAQRRLIEHVKTLYYRNDLTDSLPLYSLESKSIPYESYQLAYTPELISDIYKNTTNPLVAVNDALMLEGRFAHSKDGNNLEDVNWWIRSGTIQYLKESEVVADAQNRFYVPVSYTEPFGGKTIIKYYSTYYMMVEETEDALSNKGTVLLFNFRTLSPKRMMDPNNNISEVLTDELGLIKAMAISGKGNQADDLIGIKEETDVAEFTLIQSYFNPSSTPQGVTDSVSLANTAAQLLQNATARFVYDFDIYKNAAKPTVVASILRETHTLDENGNNNPASKLQLSFEYSSGGGNVAMKKVQAEPGFAKRVSVHLDDSILVDDVDTSPMLRWVGNGKTILNNKGNAVMQYEPYFSINHLYEDYKELVETGVTPVMYYDAAGRLIRTDMPDGSFSKVEFDSWKQMVYDANDTVKGSDWYLRRTDNTRTDFIADVKQQQAAAKATKHDNTPTILHFDTLGRSVLSIVHNRDIATDADEYYRTKVLLDIEGNLRTVIDAREIPENGNIGNTVMQYKYDMLGNQVYQKSMDAGQRWLMTNVLGNPLRSWDERDHEFSFEYDILHRPTIKRVDGGDGSTTLHHIYEKIIYGENQPNDKARNLRGKTSVVYDTAGKVSHERFDFKGSLLETTLQLCQDYKNIPDWTTPELIAMELEVFNSKSEFDALSRPVKIFTPYTTQIPASIISPAYNEASLLNTVSAKLRGSSEDIPFVKDIEYDAKGQRMSILYGNKTLTKYTYDPKTFRVLKLVTLRNSGSDTLQDLNYTYDPVGNITFIKDDAIQTLFFNNQRVEPSCDYVYDSIYRLIQATGREHIANNTAPNAYDAQRTNLPHKGDSTQLQLYTQRYEYDEVGNMKLMNNVNSWSRLFTYSPTNNQLLSAPTNNETGTPFTYKYDSNGNMINMPHLPKMEWNFKDQLQHIQITASNDNDNASGAYYVYDAGGERIRKVVEKGNVTEERIYLGGFEIFRKRRSGNLELERETLHIMDDTRRIALIDTKIKLDHTSEVPLIRYQYGKHLGSASLELDGTDQAQIISYEEYYPYGSTSYQATDQMREVPVKRYRYTGKERDEESGLEYHSARYYAVWLGRWCSCDPIGIRDGTNVFHYAGCNPIYFKDTKGKERDPSQKEINLNNERPENRRLTPDQLKRAVNLSPKSPHITGKDGNSGGSLKTSNPISMSPIHSGKDQDGNLNGTSNQTQLGSTKGDPRGTTLNGTGGYIKEGGLKKSGAGGTGKDTAMLGTPLTELDYATLLGSLFAPPLVSTDQSKVGVSGGLPGGKGSKDNASKTGQAIYIAVNLFFTFFSGLVESGLRKAWSAVKPFIMDAIKAPAFLFVGTGMGGVPRSGSKGAMSSVRRIARANAINDAVESLRAGSPTPQAQHLAERLEAVYGREALVEFMETGKLPKGVEFSHLFSASEYPEFAHRGDLGVLTDYGEHRLGHHGGDTTIPLHGMPRIRGKD